MDTDIVNSLKSLDTMKKELEKLIPHALEAVRHHLSVDENKTLVYDVYDGYAASLGAAIITSGLKPAIVFYTDVHKKKKKPEDEMTSARRYKLLQALAYTLRTSGVVSGINDTESAVLMYVIGDPPHAQKHILTASVALKLALRNFEHIKAPSKSKND